VKDPLNPELVAALCHDLRGPLGAMGTWVHVLNSDRADDQSRARALAALEGDVRTLGALIEQLSSLGSTLSDPHLAAVESIDLVPFLRERIAAAAAEHTVVTLDTLAPSFIILANPDRLRQAVSVLISGIGTPKGAREVRVEHQASIVEIAIMSEAPARPLNLALARALIEAQSGDVIESGAEGKSVVRIHLPIAP
jgi:K+-sensing histidine kinase KdpD